MRQCLTSSPVVRRSSPTSSVEPDFPTIGDSFQSVGPPSVADYTRRGYRRLPTDDLVDNAVSNPTEVNPHNGAQKNNVVPL